MRKETIIEEYEVIKHIDGAVTIEIYDKEERRKTPRLKADDAITIALYHHMRQK